MFERLLYISRAQPSVEAHVVYDIIRVSHNRNSEFDLTGALLFLDGYFVQVLEGEPFRVQERFAIITADPRHEDVQLRYACRVNTRLFPDQWMALRLQSEIDSRRFEEIGYRPGLPAAHFDAETVLRFVQACCADSKLPPT
ncbi:MAG: BLUF domain-containing protein [Pseudomonas sp.]